MGGGRLTNGFLSNVFFLEQKNGILLFEKKQGAKKVRFLQTDKYLRKFFRQQLKIVFVWFVWGGNTLRIERNVVFLTGHLL